MAILKLLNTSNILHAESFSGLTEEAGSRYTAVLMRVAGRTDCRLTDRNMSLREVVWPGRRIVQKPPAMTHTVPAFWAETGYTSLPLKRRLWMLNIPGSPHSGLQLPPTPFLSAETLCGLNLCHHSLCAFTHAWVLLCLEDASSLGSSIPSDS